MAAGRAARSATRRAWAGFRVAAEPDVARFRAALEDPRAAQRQRLRDIVARNTGTAFGRRHCFDRIDDFDRYREQVPVSTWPDVRRWLYASADANDAALISEPVLFREPTSGSGGALKPVPYTASLLGEFQRAVIPWLASLYDACPAIADGRSYWALSPVPSAAGPVDVTAPVNDVTAPAGDAAYLAGSCAERLLPTVLSPGALDPDPINWRAKSLAALIDAADLSMISVWSPTFLLALVWPLFADDGPYRSLVLERVSSPRRDVLNDAIRQGHFGDVWPALRVVSCWTDGPSALYAERLTGLFPQATLSAKGLLATEGVVSLSWGLSSARPLAVDSHALEFEDDEGRIRLAHELEHGGRYRPLLTTGGGLYRYRLGDLVEVDGFVERTPSVRFVGRADHCSDLVGEKLDEGLVRDACDEAQLPAGSIVLVPIADGEPPHYRLLIDGVDDRSAGHAAMRLEQALGNAVHYAQARRLGQLGPLRGKSVGNCAAVLQAGWEAAGGRSGDAKPALIVASARMARAIIAALEGGGSGW